MRLSIRSRVALYVTLTFAVVIVVLSLMIMELYEQYSYRSFDVTLQATASSIANRLAEGDLRANLIDVREDVAETISNFESKIGVIHVGIFDGTGGEITSVNDKEEIVPKIPLDKHKKIFTFVSMGKRYRAAFANFETGDNSEGTIVVACQLAAIQESINRMSGVVLAIAPITILIVGIGSFMIARKALKPLEKIARDIDMIQVDKPLSKLNVPRSGDEIESVAVSFNKLIQRIGTLIEFQRNFLADASHELKTPLTVIQTEIEMLLMKTGLKKEEREDLRQLLSEAEYAAKIASDLIYLSKLESSVVERFVPVNFDTIVENVVSHQRPVAKRKGISLDVELRYKKEVKVSAVLLHRAFVNILENSIKYSRNDGRVSIKTFEDDTTSRAILTVEDNGIGISDEELPRVFDRFYRTRSARSGNEKGSGLGLSIAKRIVEQHQGTITIKSKLNVGTSVRVEIPGLKKGMLEAEGRKD
jgi:signal transduction histidine kinase